MQVSRRAHLDADALAGRVFLHDVLHQLRGEPNRLLPFHAVLALHPRGEHYSGVRPIEVARIIGSVDRYDDFDHHFLPKRQHTLARWTHLRALQLAGEELPPIEVYKAGKSYFVKDGNHRVALAKSQKQKYIDAEIIEIDAPISPEPGDTVMNLILKGEHAKFLEATQLDTLIPGHEPILFSVLGRYDILLDYIRTRHYLKCMAENRHIPWQLAVVDWYENAYLPLVRAFREHRVLERFPERTEADLYLWLVDHHHLLSQGNQVALDNHLVSLKPGFRSWWKRVKRQLPLFRKEGA
jgi:hypothetical protein